MLPWLQVVEVEILQVIESLFFRLAQLCFERLAGRVGGNAPVLGQVLRNLAFLSRAEAAKCTPQEDQGPAEGFFVQRSDVIGQLCPEHLPGQEGVAVSPGKSLEPARAQIRRDARREPPRYFPDQLIIGEQPALEQYRAGVS